MAWAFRLYISGLILSPLLMLFTSPRSVGIAGAFGLLLLLLVLITTRPGETRFGFDLLRPFLILASLPAIWMVVQVLPVPPMLMGKLLPAASAFHAGTASSWTTVSIHPNASLFALGVYVCALALGVSTVFLAIDRSRAERLLLFLALLTTCIALVRPVHDLGGFFFLGEIASVGPRATITSAAVLGVVLNTAAGFLILERFESRRKHVQFSLTATIGELAVFMLACAICLLILVLFASAAAVFAALTGLGTLLLITAFRRSGLTPRSGYLLAAIGVAVPIAFVAGSVSNVSRDITLRFDSQAPEKVLGAVQDALSAAPPLGFGAGTFETLMSTGPQIRSRPTIFATTPPTAVAGLLLELGRAATLMILIAVFAVAVLLIRGALTRGRDSFLPALGAAAVLALTAEAFSDASLFSLTGIAIDMAVVGLAIAQSASRRAAA